MDRKKILRFAKVALIVYCGIGILIYYLQDYFLLQPKKIEQNAAYAIAQPHSEAKIDINRESAWYYIKFPSTVLPKKGLVLYCHGNKTNVEHYAKYSEVFTKKGYDVWMPDYPGFGKSTGELNEKVLYEVGLQMRKLAATEYADDSILVYGKSLGTAVAAYVAANTSNKALVLETPYYSVPELIDHFTLIYPSERLANYKLRNYELLPDVKEPITVFQGTDDWITVHRDAIKLKQFLKPTDQFYSIEGAGHNDLYGTAIYQQKMDSLLAH